MTEQLLLLDSSVMIALAAHSEILSDILLNCAECEADLPPEAFPRNAAKKRRGCRAHTCFGCEARLRRLHKRITRAQKLAMYAEQEGCCAGCGRHEERLIADMDHKTGILRAMLCHRCNTVLGFVRDSGSTLRNLTVVVERIPVMARA